MTRRLIAALSVAALTITAAAVYAAGRDHGPKDFSDGPPGMAFGHPGMVAPFMLHRLADELNLTEQQRTTIKGMFESARPNMQSLREEARTTAEQLRKTQPDDANYVNAVAQASQKASELAGRLVTDGSQLRSQVWQVLTPEQKTKFVELQGKMHERMKDRRQHRRPPPDARNDAAKLDADAYPAVTELPTMVVSATRI